MAKHGRLFQKISRKEKKKQRFKVELRPIRVLHFPFREMNKH